ncbi:hypothetical protein ES703_05187 [subsurface metagenome]
MSLKDLEEKAVEIRVRGDLHKIVQILGSVESVSGFNKDQKFLDINLKTIKNYVGLLKFYGTSPVRGGDIIKAGLVLNVYYGKRWQRTYSKKDGSGSLLYLGILKQDGSFGRIDFMDGYNPMHDDAIKLGLF